MGIGGGSRKSSGSGLYGTSDTNSMAGMPYTGSMAGMPNTMYLSDYWGEIHEGRLENRDGSGFTSGEENAERTRAGWRTKEERKADREAKRREREQKQKQKKQKTTQDLLEEKMEDIVKDPQEARREGMIKLTEEDAYPDFISKKCKRGGSVVASPQGICLMGEDRQQSLGGEDTYVYSIKNGIREWRKANGLDIEGGEGSAKGNVVEVKLLSGIEYDVEKHQLIAKYVTLPLLVKSGTDKDAIENAEVEEVVFTATSHAAEHGGNL